MRCWVWIKLLLRQLIDQLFDYHLRYDSGDDDDDDDEGAE